MSFIKSLLLAIIATVFLTYVFGMGLIKLFDISIYMGESLIEPLKTISVSALIGVILCVVAVAIVVSVFGSLIFVTLLCLGGLAMVVLGFFWPIVFIAIAIWLLNRNSAESY